MIRATRTTADSYDGLGVTDIRPRPLKVSFDFDGTLEHPLMQSLAIRYLSAGADVWITTSRPDTVAGKKVHHPDLMTVAGTLGLADKITYTSYKPKAMYLDGFDIHYDDVVPEVEEINLTANSCVAVLYMHYKTRNKL